MSICCKTKIVILMVFQTLDSKIFFSIHTGDQHYLLMQHQLADWAEVGRGGGGIVNTISSGEVSVREGVQE